MLSLQVYFGVKSVGIMPADMGEEWSLLMGEDFMIYTENF